jgi:repressor LexA
VHGAPVQTQAELAQAAGISRSNLSLIEIGRFSSVKEDTLERLAKAFGMSLSELTAEIWGSVSPLEAKIIAVPLFSDFRFHAGMGVEPVDEVYLPATSNVSKSVSAYRVTGDCLVPSINDNDIIVVDKEAPINNGDIVAALVNNEMHLGRFRKIGDSYFLENNHARFKLEDISIIAPVIQVVRRLK